MSEFAWRLFFALGLSFGVMFVLAMVLSCAGASPRAAAYKLELHACATDAGSWVEYDSCEERVDRRYGIWDGGHHDAR